MPPGGWDHPCLLPAALRVDATLALRVPVLMHYAQAFAARGGAPGTGTVDFRRLHGQGRHAAENSTLIIFSCTLK